MSRHLSHLHTPKPPPVSETDRKCGRKNYPYALDTFLVTLGDVPTWLDVMAALKPRSRLIKISSSGTKAVMLGLRKSEAGGHGGPERVSDSGRLFLWVMW